MWVRIIYYDKFWETFFQDVGCDGTDISDDIDLEVRVHIQSVWLIIDLIQLTWMPTPNNYPFFQNENAAQIIILIHLH